MTDQPMNDQPGNLCIIEDAAQQVSVNVGGHLYTISLQTLRARPDSNLSKVFCGSWKMQRNDQGQVFVDRDGEVCGAQLPVQAQALILLSLHLS